MGSETKPTPGEIERAKEIAAKYPPAEQRRHVGIQTIVVNVSLALEGAIAHALADAREQERERCVGATYSELRGSYRWIAERVDRAIRRGEP